MISRLTGTILETTDKYAIIDVHGVGYTVYATPDTLTYLAGTVSTMVYTYQVVREDALDLYGFTSAEDLNFFELLISVSGIGPRSALGILAITSVESLATAIATGDTGYLTKVSGIGRKTAEKIVLELRDKLQAHRRTDETSSTMRAESDVIEALKSLGYSQNEARDAVKNIPASIEGANARIKEALKILGSK
jgi:holliday junction DNA helicase RuvA